MKITENFTYIGTSQNFERDSYATLAEKKSETSNDNSEKKVNKGGKK